MTIGAESQEHLSPRFARDRSSRTTLVRAADFQAPLPLLMTERGSEAAFLEIRNVAGGSREEVALKVTDTGEVDGRWQLP